MKKNAPRCDEILIFIIFVGRQRFRRDVYVLVMTNSLLLKMVLYSEFSH